MLKEGNFTGNPKDFHPAGILTRIIYLPDCPPTLMAYCADKLLPYFAAPVAAQLRAEQQGNNQGDTNITVIVQKWAAGETRRADIEVEPLALPNPDSRTSEDSE